MVDSWRIGFTGARELSAPHRYVVAPHLSDLAADVFVTGAATGIDSYVGQMMAQLRPKATHRVFVPADKSRVDYWWHRHSVTDLEVTWMPPGTTYADRNRAIVGDVHELVAFPMWAEADPRSARSGTWQTVRMARRAGLVVREVVLTRVESG